MCYKNKKAETSTVNKNGKFYLRQCYEGGDYRGKFSGDTRGGYALHYARNFVKRKMSTMARAL